MKGRALASSFLAAWALVVVTAPVAAFNGRVTSPDGRPIADATISILGRAGQARTDADGRFRWEPDPPVPFLVLVTRDGGTTFAPITVESLGDEEIALVVSPGKTERVKVTAEVAPHLDVPPASATTLQSRADLTQRRPERLADVLENVPGAGRVGGGHEAVPALRGLARGRTLLLLDGARVVSERRAGPSATFLDPAALGAVEISRGPGSVGYGSDAFGGVILTRSPRSHADAPFAARFDTSLGIGGAPQAGAALELAGGAGGGGWVGQFRWRDQQDWRGPDGTIPNSEATDLGFLLSHTRELGPGKLDVVLRRDVARDVERPTVDALANPVAQPDETSERLVVDYQSDPLDSGATFGLHVFTGRYGLATLQREVASGASQRSDVAANDWGARARMTRPFEDARLALGLDAHGRTDLQATNTIDGVTDVAIADATASNVALFVSGERRLAGRLDGSAGLRWGRSATRGEGPTLGSRSTDRTPWSGHAALRVELPRALDLSLQLARGFREPSLSDRYFTGVTGRGFAIGNPDLEPETSHQFDLALRRTGRRLVSAIYLYDYRIDDLVERYRSPSDSTQFLFRNRGEAHLKGAEFELRAELRPGLDLQVGAQAARGEAEDGSDLDDVPPTGLFAQLRALVREEFDLQARVAYVVEDDRPGPGELRVPGYATVDLGAGWRPTPQVELRLSARNLLDRRYPAAADERSTLAPGRSALLVLTVRSATRSR